MIAPKDLFELDGLTHKSLFEGIELVWDVLDRIKEYTIRCVEEAGSLPEALTRNGVVLADTVVIHQGVVHESGFELLGGDPTKGKMKVRLGDKEVTDAVLVYQGAAFMDNRIHLAPGCKVEPGALLKGPSFIGPGTEVRQGAYLRGGCLVGKACVVGHTTEIKNSVMLDGAKAGHFAYLGDSILGRDVNLGAGTKLANLKILESPYRITVKDELYVIKRRKFGAILGDKVETGCNTVTNPGTVMGKRSMVSPCSSVKGGFHKPRTIIR
jgi:carbonic anhydrase/acetyltransferase-like protein (isoleucine patch superfamily)